jgi:GNAT superfamily N-acetyltransferase
MGELGPTDLRLMQGLAQQVTAVRPELLNGDATTFRETETANLIWQVHPDRSELLTEILDWYDDVAGDGVDRLLTVQVGDARARAALERVRGTWPYRADLHVLVEAPDGTLAATAIGWLDDSTRTAEFEPVGIYRDFRRQGLGTALQLYGMQRARAAGANRMFVACLGAPAHPAARNLYYGVGFREFTRDLPQIRRMATS